MNIDTIVLKYYTEITREILQSRWDKSEVTKANGGWQLSYRLNEEIEKGAVIKCTYYPCVFGKRTMLPVEFSIPTVIYGNNYTVVQDFELAVVSINRILASIDGLPPNTVEDGIVHRVDLFYDHQVGDLVPYYVKALQSLEYAYRTTAPWTSQGVQFWNKERCTKFYDKEKESGDPLNHGVLRQETTLRNRAVQKLTGVKKPNIFDLAPNLIKAALEKDLQDLDLFGKSIGNADTTLPILCQQFGELGGIFYYGMLHARANLTEEMILSATKSHPRSLDRRLQKIVDLGIAPTLTGYQIPLPPLVIGEM